MFADRITQLFTIDDQHAPVCSIFDESRCNLDRADETIAGILDIHRRAAQAKLICTIREVTIYCRNMRASSRHRDACPRRRSLPQQRYENVFVSTRRNMGGGFSHRKNVQQAKSCACEPLCNECLDENSGDDMGDRRSVHDSLGKAQRRTRWRAAAERN